MRMLDISPYGWEKMVLTMGSTLYGIVIPQGISTLRKAIPDLLEDAENTLSPYFRELLRELYDEIVHFDERIETIELKLKVISDQ